MPLPGLRSSLVCVVEPRDAEHLRTLDAAALSAEIERRAHSILGKVAVEDGRGIFPLAVETAHSFAGSRIALAGEAAHVIPPIGAQGLNLGLRDAATISELVVEARREGVDLGSPELLARYDRMRRVDATSRTVAVVSPEVGWIRPALSDRPREQLIDVGDRHVPALARRQAECEEIC